MSVPVHAEQGYRITSPCTVERCLFQEVKAVVREAYRRLGKRVTFTPLPVRRELQSVSMGQRDATLARVSLPSSERENLEQVPFPLLRAVIGPVSADPAIRVEELEDLARFRVGCLRGGVIAALLCERAGVVPDQINGIANAVRMLQEDRIEVYVEDLVLASVVAEDLGIGIHIGEPLYWGYFYHWVNKKHAALAPELARVFREMLADGTTERLLGKYAAMRPEAHWGD